MCEIYDIFQNFNFVEGEGNEDFFHDAPQDASHSLV